MANIPIKKKSGKDFLSRYFAYKFKGMSAFLAENVT